MTAHDKQKTPSPSSQLMGVTLTAETVIAMRDALIRNDVAEAYHQLYQAVDPTFCRYEPWADTEAQLRPAPAEHVAGTEERGIGIGMAIAAGIIMRAWGQEVYAREILGSAGLDTLEKLQASGVDQYDIDALMPVVATAT